MFQEDHTDVSYDNNLHGKKSDIIKKSKKPTELWNEITAKNNDNKCLKPHAKKNIASLIKLSGEKFCLSLSFIS